MLTAAGFTVVTSKLGQLGGNQSSNSRCVLGKANWALVSAGAMLFVLLNFCYKDSRQSAQHTDTAVLATVCDRQSPSQAI